MRYFVYMSVKHVNKKDCLFTYPVALAPLNRGGRFSVSLCWSP